MMAVMPHAVDAADATHPREDPDPEVSERARNRRFGAAYKLRVLTEYDGLDKAGKGALLRREGLYSSLVSEWRKQRDHGTLAALAQKRGRPEVELASTDVVYEGTGPTTKRPPRHPWRTVSALGGTRNREREDRERADAMIGAAVQELAPVVGTRAACSALGRPPATHYRRLHPPAPRPHPEPKPQPRALAENERLGVLDLLHSDRFVDVAPPTVYAQGGRPRRPLSTTYHG